MATRKAKVDRKGFVAIRNFVLGPGEDGNPVVAEVGDELELSQEEYSRVGRHVAHAKSEEAEAARKMAKARTAAAKKAAASGDA